MFQGGEFALGFLDVLLEPRQFAVHAFAYLLQCLLGFEDVQLFDGGDVVEGGEGKVIVAAAAMEPDEPYEEFVNDFGILTQVLLEVEEVAVVEGCHHADVVEGRGIALVTLDGIGVGVYDVGVLKHPNGTGCLALKQIVEVGIDTGNHAGSQGLSEFVHHGGFLAAIEVGAAGQHHFEGGVVVFELAQHATPEEDVVIRFNVCHNLPLFRFGTKAVGCLDVGGGEVGSETLHNNL